MKFFLLVIHLSYRDFVRTTTRYGVTFPVQTYFPTFRLKIPQNSTIRLVPTGNTTKQLQDIIMEAPASSHVSITSTIPTVYDLCDGSVTSTTTSHPRFASNPAASYQPPQNEPSPPDEVYMPSSSAYLRNATNHASSNVAHRVKSSNAGTWCQGNLISQKLDTFADTILPSPVQIQLAQTFGKDSIHHSFYAARCFCHVLLPPLKSGFLSCRATKALEKASRQVRQLQQLRKKHQNIDFLPLQGLQANWESTTSIREDWKAMTTARLLHFDGDVATVVRWIGGPHVNAHLNVARILATLQPIVDPDIYRDVERIFTFGAPALCNANASEANFQAYLK
jgi:hypothetical protein